MSLENEREEFGTGGIFGCYSLFSFVTEQTLVIAVAAAAYATSMSSTVGVLLAIKPVSIKTLWFQGILPELNTARSTKVDIGQTKTDENMSLLLPCEELLETKSYFHVKVVQ